LSHNVRYIFILLPQTVAHLPHLPLAFAVHCLVFAGRRRKAVSTQMQRQVNVAVGQIVKLQEKTKNTKVQMR
jgi:hypothetical protein